jgi:hypothetical protein
MRYIKTYNEINEALDDEQTISQKDKKSLSIFLDQIDCEVNYFHSSLVHYTPEWKIDQSGSFYNKSLTITKKIVDKDAKCWKMGQKLYFSMYEHNEKLDNVYFYIQSSPTGLVVNWRNANKDHGTFNLADNEKRAIEVWNRIIKFYLDN